MQEIRQTWPRTERIIARISAIYEHNHRSYQLLSFTRNQITDRRLT